MLNQCTFTGHLGKDPTTRTFQDGGKVCSFSIAVSEKWKDKNTGEQREKTEWIPIEIFGDGLAGVAEKYLHKGSKVLIQGKFKTRKWQDQSGNDRWSTSIVLQGFGGILEMLDGKPKSDGQSGDQSQGGYGGHPQGGNIDDDIPF